MDFSFSDDLYNFPKFGAAAFLLLSYARFASSRLRPGLLRLFSLLPVLSLFPFLPFLFSTIILRVISAFYLNWLALFKLLLLSFDLPPLSPSLPLLSFLAFSSLPIKAKNPKDPPTHFSLLSLATKAALVSVIFSIYRYKQQLSSYIVFSLYCLHLYIALDLVFFTTAWSVGWLIRTELEPQFNKPYLSSSLRDFWGRRWNLMVSDILRPTVYHPIRNRYGPMAGVIATFAMSGLMHEFLFCYITLDKPTGEVTLFFLLHGVCTALEGWWVRHKNWWVPAVSVRLVLTLGFVAGTGYWLFFPPILRNHTDDIVVAECLALIGFGSLW
ncbi:MBOAT (membrane bound O-acyl transferase) family protein [Rhynchospora pubera]|uniref:MBOAT (Membrane bound O-acyl transferase) family protein n=1 Tax=Rhynchospora pubera TaxID=906938 RepID=A0AAV8G936_9POAL|nr:MBOAT (membrane bound O-acyl transferase) family protein [Rhynchospora pubera]